MKNTTNVFLEGLRTDLHPLSTGLQYLTDALNATLLTFNGNEMMLQNDMGNTLILDSAVGNILGLSPGFIPTGLKEHGGIMYITSVNKDGEGEIGTIPSPIIRSIYKDKVTYPVNQKVPIDKGDALVITHKLYPADKFIANLQMFIEDQSELVGTAYKKSSLLSPTRGVKDDPSDIILKRTVINGGSTLSYTDIYTPLVSYHESVPPTLQLDGMSTPISLFSTNGVYKLELFYTNDNGSTPLPAGDHLQDRLEFGTGNLSNYWYLHTDDPSSVFPKDLLLATLNENLKVFPSYSKPGKLAVRLSTEGITNFGILPRNPAPHETPITFKSFKSGIALYFTYFPGFYYSTNSGIYIDKFDNLRVIDESTNTSVPLLFPYKGDSTVKLFTNFNCTGVGTTTSSDLNTEFKLYGTGGPQLLKASTLPQLLSRVANSDGIKDTFILTPIPTINDHTSTTFTFSTQGVDESDHTGLFGINLNDKYNNWYRLEFDYLDLYDVKLGSFTLRFNPYLNDVFGTNLSLNEGLNELANLQLVIGLQYNISESVISYKAANKTFSYSKPIASSDAIKAGLYERDGSEGVITDHISKATSAISWSTFNRDTKSYAISYSTDTNVSSALAVYTDPNFSYFYIPQALTYSVKSLPSSVDKASFYMTKDEGSGSLNHLAFRTVYKVDGLAVTEYKFNRAIDWGTIHTASWDYKIGTRSDTIQYRTNWTSYNTTSNSFPTFLSSSINNTDAPTCTISFSALPASSDLFSLQKSYSANILAEDASVYYRSGPLYHGDSVFSIEYSPFPFVVLSTYPYLLAYNSTKSVALKMNYDYSLPTLEIKLPEVLNLPLYAITPYFLLKGVNDLGKLVNIQRFSGGTSTNLSYECNFETVKGNVYNYIPNNGVGTEEASFSPSDNNVLCSYNHDSKFSYYKEDFVWSQYLLAGIYVLNIQRCPGVSNWIMLANGPGSSDDEALLNLEIDVNGTTYAYKDWNVPYWLSTPKYVGPSPAMSNPTCSSGTSMDRIYTPIVLVVKSGCSVRISVKALGELHKFNRQSIGLFKVRDVGASEISGVAFKKDLYLYHDYMKFIATEAQSLHSTEPIKLYNFIQKYGVFFREGYVYIDGLYNTTTNLINPVSFKTTTYKSYPYIPLDPSILPVYLDKTYSYVWNAYVLPNEVLDNPDTSFFVFSNPISSTKYSTKAASGNLRQLN